MDERVFIGVGSNIDPERNIQAAGLLLRERFRVVGVSTFFRSAPVERTDQDDFLNGVIELETHLGPRTLKFDALREIEAELGRRRNGDPHAPREIDLDLLVYGSRQIREADLRVPDPDISRRPFVAVPLLELAPDLTVPGQGRLDALAVVRRRGEIEPEPGFSSGLKVRLLK